jgi:hypothetical protein
MAWRNIVRIRKPRNRLPLFSPTLGNNLIEVVEEADGPIATRYGLRLPLTIRLLESNERFTWLIPWRDEVGNSSILGQLKRIADEYGGLKGLRLNVIAVGSKGSTRYRVEVIRG